MFTATKDLMLPTTVTGSWPRPKWFDQHLSGRGLSDRMREMEFREQYTDALAVLLDEQERAGLDILTHGDYHGDDLLGGYQWVMYPLERLTGLEGMVRKPEMEDSYSRGSVLGEIVRSWRWPNVVGKIERSEATPLEFAKIWRLAQARAAKPVMFGGISIPTAGAGLALKVADGSPYTNDDHRQYLWDMAAASNQELRELAAAGCQIIQIEEPLFHFIAATNPDHDEVEFLIDLFNHEVEGLDDVEVWAHTCWGNPAAQYEGGGASYGDSIEIYLNRLNADVVTFEGQSSNGEIIDVLKPFADVLRDQNKKVALGAISHRSLQVESPADVASFTRRALEAVPIEHLALTSDCGFGHQGVGRLIASHKACSLAQGANIIRRELGMEERDVPMANPALQAD